MTVQPLQRHSLVWLDPGMDVASCLTFAEHEAAVREWIAKGLPLVAARQPRQHDGRVTHHALGLTLPPPTTRQRVFLSVPADAVIRRSGPLSLEQARDAGDRHCRELIQQVVAVCQTARVSPYVYGSMMWQAVSGRRYMTEASDLDILFLCDGSSDTHWLINSLEYLEGSQPGLDGEILAPSGWAAAWREVAAAGKPGGLGTVLAKSNDEVGLLSLDAFWGRKET